MKLLQYFSHEYSLVFIKDESAATEEDKALCFCLWCEEQVEGPPRYYCSGRGGGSGSSSSGYKYYLHDSCADLEFVSEINHPFHLPHPLFLLSESPYSEHEGISYHCNLCGKMCFGFVYHCMPCDFGMDVNCAFLQPSTIRKFPKLQHFGHQHPLFLIEKHNKGDYVLCAACGKQLSNSGAIYTCVENCKFDLHKKCAELPMEINHPFHPLHPLILLKQSPSFKIRNGVRKNFCRFCHGFFTGFVYRCASCNFDLDVDCALLQLSIAGNFDKLEHFSHEHPLIFNEKYNKDVNSHCCGCQKPIVDPFYRCVDCNSFDLHKECVELPREINHPYHRRHPLTLLPNPPIHPEKCSCYWCRTTYKGFIYYCSPCNFGLNPENVSLPRVIQAASHEHPWILLSTCISFICNFCGTDGDCAPYVCTICDLVVHKNCISLPHKIRITHHRHRISHTYFLQKGQYEMWECRICHDEVNVEYGNYHCSASGCNYIAHVKCAIDAISWDGAFMLQDKGETVNESMNLITDVIEKMSIGDVTVAIQIKHAYHEHNLTLTSVGEVKDDNICDGCMRNISLPYYSCEQCGFFLHKHCAELRRVKQHPIHKHWLTLRRGNYLAFCAACNRFHHGFSYTCDKKSCDFKIDIQCSLLSNSLIHPSHEHILLLTHEYEGDCRGCNGKNELVYRCKQRCGFALGFECLTLPLTTWYKYDKHPLALTYYDDSDQSQLYCDICEEERNPSDWFYYCSDCDNSVHPKCVLGDLPFIKLGSLRVSNKHPHILKFVKKIWNCPPCHECGNRCSGQSLECLQSDCNRIFHFECING